MLSLHTEGVQQAFSHTLPSAPYVGHTMYSAPPATDDELSQASASFAQSEVNIWEENSATTKRYVLELYKVIACTGNTKWLNLKRVHLFK